MNEQDDLTAADLLNTYTEDEIVRVLRDFGEEKFARRIASAIVEQRSESPFSTTAELVELIRRSIPAAARRTGRNPSKRTFQALRIEINDELGVFRRALADALELLNVGGLPFARRSDREANVCGSDDSEGSSRPSGGAGTHETKVPAGFAWCRESDGRGNRN